MTSERASVSSPVLLEQLFNIPNEQYVTGSERLDGFVIGLATMLLIRNAEFVIVDLLSLFFGNRKDKVAFRVLRTWQMLNFVSIFSLLSGFDSDIPCSRYRLFSFFFGSARGWTFCRFRVNKGTFATALFIAVLGGKLLILSAEVAIIAFVIPSAKCHKAKGGVTLALSEAVITETDMQNLRPCHPMLNTTFLTDFAQLTLCRRFFSGGTVVPILPRWLPNETIHIKRAVIQPHSAANAGAILLNSGSSFSCVERNDSGSSIQRNTRLSRGVDHQVSFTESPDVSLVNDVNVGELAVDGNGNMMTSDGKFRGVVAGMTPILTDRQGMLRLSFADWFDERISDDESVWTLNGKLLFGGTSALPGRTTFEFCPAAVDEIIRVTGTLNAEMILDMLLLSAEIKPTASFSTPTTDTSNTTRVRGFEIGVSRTYPISPIWLAVSAGATVLLSAITASFNHTEATMARVYREQNSMNGALSPVFLHQENHEEAMLFRCGESYHWGKNPDEEWKEVEGIYFSENAVLT